MRKQDLIAILGGDIKMLSPSTRVLFSCCKLEFVRTIASFVGRSSLMSNLPFIDLIKKRREGVVGVSEQFLQLVCLFQKL